MTSKVDALNWKSLGSAYQVDRMAACARAGARMHAGRRSGGRVGAGGKEGPRAYDIMAGWQGR